MEAAMKQFNRLLVGMILSTVCFVFQTPVICSAGSIEGTVSYGGTQTGAVVVAAFTLPPSCAGDNPSPYQYFEIPREM